MEEKSNKKQNLLLILGLFVLISMVGGLTYAFFNYTKTGAANNLKVGRMAFNSNQSKTINLTNTFPISRNEALANTNAGSIFELTITGDTDYTEGIEYLVSSVDTVNYVTVNNKRIEVPISMDINVTDLGTENNNYFIERESNPSTMYKIMATYDNLENNEKRYNLTGDQMLLVGYIAPNNPTGTADGIDGKITIKAYLDDDKIAISDTYDGTESDNMGTPNSMAQGKTVLTTTEWNALSSSGISFQIKVEANEGIWVNGSLYDIMQKNSLGVDTEQGVDFSKTSEKDGTLGVYMRAGTENDAYPIMYYRGAVEDNNVMFANKCWKTVRTTDTGGVKLIYNGETGNVYDKVALSQDKYTIVTNTDGKNSNVWTFDSTDNSWNTSYTTGSLELSFKVPAGDDYIFEMTGQNGSSGIGWYTIYKGTNSVNNGGVDAPFALNHPYGTLTADDVVRFSFSGGGFTTPLTIKIKMIAPGELLTSSGCDNTGANTQITLTENNTSVNTFKFNENTNSPAYNGYMYGTVYEYSTANWTSGARFGNGFTWDGTNYTLVDDSVTTPDATHHYSCNVTTTSGTCQELRYVYYGTNYITLTDGDGVEEALEKMQTNTNPSNAKTQIDSWYASNMTSYTSKLEDTIWCNDRSMGNGNNSGWIANGGSLSGLSEYLNYGAYQRSASATNSSTVKNQPSLACVNKNDAFTVNNGNGNQKLQYPVAMLTADEMVLAGGIFGQTNGAFYLTTGNGYWSLSPSYFNTHNSGAFEFGLGTNGYINIDNRLGYTLGLRPAVSLKPGTPVISGEGTVSSPYIIG